MQFQLSCDSDFACLKIGDVYVELNEDKSASSKNSYLKDPGKLSRFTVFFSL